MAEKKLEVTEEWVNDKQCCVSFTDLKTGFVRSYMFTKKEMVGIRFALGMLRIEQLRAWKQYIED